MYLLQLNSIKKNSHSGNEISFSKTILPEKLTFSERVFKDGHQEKIALLQEAGTINPGDLPLSDSPEAFLGEGHIFSEKGEKGLKNPFLLKVRERIESEEISSRSTT